MSDLTCPSPSGLGDVALQLQQTALEAEAKIFAQEKLLRQAVNNPMVVVTTTAAITGLANGLDYTISDGLGATMSTVFNNAVISDPDGAFQELFGLGGIIACGAAFNAVAAGAVTDNSLRLTAIGTYNVDTGADLLRAFYTNYETTASGGVDVSIQAVFAVQPGEGGRVTFRHDNVASTLNISTGAFFWATRLGDLSVVKVV